MYARGGEREKKEEGSKVSVYTDRYTTRFLDKERVSYLDCHLPRKLDGYEVRLRAIRALDREKQEKSGQRKVREGCGGRRKRCLLCGDSLPERLGILVLQALGSKPELERGNGPFGEVANVRPR